MIESRKTEKTKDCPGPEQKATTAAKPAIVQP
jgi:hypothetical protein